MEHLLPSVASALSWPEQARIELAQSTRWIPYQGAQHVLAKLDTLLRYPRNHRMPCLLVVGETNNGKSEILRHFCRLHPIHVQGEEGFLVHPVVFVHAPLEADEQAFHITVLEALGAVYPKQENVQQRRWRVIKLLQRLKVRVLVIDEIHNILAGSLRAHQNFLNLLRLLTNETGIPLVGAGIESASNAVNQDEQLSNRFDTVRLEKWQYNTEFRRLLASYERLLPLKNASNLSAPGLARDLFNLCEGIIGELDTVLTMATVVAIQTQYEQIDQAVLNKLEYVSRSRQRSR